MSELSRRREATAVPTLVNLEGPRASARKEAEAFVATAFRIAYGATVTHFMPTLMTLRSDAGQLLAVIGIRDADRAPLFLEQYLEQPIEQALGYASGCRIERSTVVEVGNFAVAGAGGGRWMITALTAFMSSAGKGWAVFTCGPELRNAFHRFGIDLVELGEADPRGLSEDERIRWGSYYAQRPRVMAASVSQGYPLLAALFDGECVLNTLWRDALQAGLIAP